MWSDKTGHTRGMWSDKTGHTWVMWSVKKGILLGSCDPTKQGILEACDSTKTGRPTVMCAAVQNRLRQRLPDFLDKASLFLGTTLTYQWMRTGSVISWRKILIPDTRYILQQKIKRLVISTRVPLKCCKLGLRNISAIQRNKISPETEEFIKLTTVVRMLEWLPIFISVDYTPRLLWYSERATIAKAKIMST